MIKELKNRRQEFWRLLVAGSISELIDLEGTSEDRPVDLLAGLFEKAGDKAPEALTDFLRRPTAAVAVAALLHRDTLPANEREAAEEAGNILQMWTYSLIGVLHRISPAVSDKPFGGVVKFVREVQATLADLKNHASWATRPEFLIAVERCIRAARKWGIDGWTYRERTVDLRPLTEFLAKQAQVCQSFDSRNLDVLAYGARLQEQRYDIEAEAKENESPGARAAPPMPGVTAWDVQIDDHYCDPSSPPSALLAAISWSHGPPELYRLTCPPPAVQPAELDQMTCRPPRPEPTRSGWNLERIWPMERNFPESPGQYTRGLTISRSWEDRIQPLLIIARRARRTRRISVVERIDIVAISETVTNDPSSDLPGPLLNPKRKEGDRCQLSEGESVYSALDLEAGLVLLGLRGPNGKARLAILKIPTPEQAELIELENELAPASPPGASEVRNPIWSIATHRATKNKAHHDVAIGCNDGSVWYLKIPLYQDLGDREEIKKLGREAKRVGVLGAAVWAVAIRTADPDPTLELSKKCQRAPRVFGGGADGSVVAWQQAEQGEWLPVWATREASAIGRIHLFDRLPGPDVATLESEGRHVLALTHSGYAVILLDRPDIEAPTDDTSIQLKVPGQRIERIKLGLPVLTSDVLRLNFGDSPWPRVLVASDDGRMRLVGPTLLRNTQDREDARARTPLWPKAIGVGESATERLATIKMRLHAGMATVSDSIRLIPVEWVLQPRPPGTGLRPSSAPRYLSGLFVLANAWNEAYVWNEPRYGKNSSVIFNSFDNILRNCRRTHDPMLFREIAECVLRRMNDELVAKADSPGEMETARAIALGLIEVLESIDGVWLGAADNMDVKLKIVQVKALLDSRVLLRLGETDSNRDDREHDLKLLRARVDFVTSFLGREPLLTLEVLGAVNRSLLRCARYMRKDASDVKGASSLEWEAIAAFFWRLKAVIARLAHPGTGLDDVLRHEAARAFALAMCCVPSQILLLSHLLSEANLSFEIFMRVDEQLRTLREFGICVPEGTEELFRTATIWDSKDRHSERIRDQLMRPTVLEKITGCGPEILTRPEVHQLKQWLAPERAAKRAPPIDSDNCAIVRQWAPWHLLVQELYNLADSLERQPNLFSTVWLAEFARALGESGDRRDRFAETRAFWKKHLDLEGSGAWIRWAATPREARATKLALRPELLSELAPLLAKWCQEVIAEAAERQRGFQLFEPHASAYVAAVSRLLAVSRHLPHSAAVLSSIVVGVLNHGLLESLAETVFEFAEIARTLDPDHEARERRTREDPSPSPVPRAFANYLDRLRKKAGGVPRTLRTLKQVLDSAALDEGLMSIADLFEYHRTVHDDDGEGGGWRLSSLEPTDANVPIRTARSIMIALAELHHNDREYGPKDRREGGPKARVVGNGTHLQIHVTSRLDGTRKQNVLRLQKIMKTPTTISRPMDPSDDAKGMSHGTGLYMAKLALTLVDWDLKILKVDRKAGTLITMLSGPSAARSGR